PIADIPKHCASYNIVPDPLNGSSKTDSLGNCSNICFASIGDILPLYGYIPCIDFGLLTDFKASNFNFLLLLLFTMYSALSLPIFDNFFHLLTFYLISL